MQKSRYKAFCSSVVRVLLGDANRSSINNVQATVRIPASLINSISTLLKFKGICVSLFKKITRFSTSPTDTIVANSPLYTRFPSIKVFLVNMIRSPGTTSSSSGNNASRINLL